MRRRFFITLLFFTCAVLHAQTDRAPILIGLGYTQNDKGDLGFWIAGARTGTGTTLSAKAASKLAIRGRRYRVFTMRGEQGNVTGDTAQYTEDGEQGYQVATTKSFSKETFPCLVLSGVSKHAGRIPKSQVAQNPQYEKAVTDWVRAQKKSSLPHTRIIQHWRVDLNGDGEDEVLLTGMSRADYEVGNARVGDYGYALLRFYDGKRVQTASLGFEYADKSRAKQFPFSAPAQYQIIACPDINGDGRQEIAVVSTAHESELLEIFTFDGKTVRKILSESWGL